MNRRRFFRWATQRLAPYGVPFLRRWMLALGRGSRSSPAQASLGATRAPLPTLAKCAVDCS